MSFDGLRQSSRHACREAGSFVVSTGTAKYRERDLRSLAPPDISAHREVDGDVGLELAAFFSLYLDFLTFGGRALTCSLEQTFGLSLAARSDLLAIPRKGRLSENVLWLTRFRINGDEIAAERVVAGLPERLLPSVAL